MFGHLPHGDFEPEDLMALGAAMMAPAKQAMKLRQEDAESRTPAGYTFLGQFIAHDISFDPASSLDRENDPNALVDFRTPRFDLDSVYGRGPADQPYLYDGDDMLLGERLQNRKDFDLPRIPKTNLAVIADPRNDENVIISQLHAVFLRFHNQVRAARKADFATVQRMVRWHYQWVVVHDFLHKIVNADTYAKVLPDPRNVVAHPPELMFYAPRNFAYLPVEFSAAAYRFGHSTIRPHYRLNTGEREGGPFLIFDDNPNQDLRGRQRLNPTWAIDWALFFEGVSSKRNDGEVQRSHKIDTSLTAPLAHLPMQNNARSLAQLNLLRGLRLGLPSGQAVAHALGEPVIPDEHLTVGSHGGGGKIERLTDVFPRFCCKAPLWYYVLAEAAHCHQGEKLGPVGGRIVMETIVGLLMADRHSYLRQQPLWTPDFADGGEFGMADLVRIAVR
jgi:hypothetical protein